MRRDRLLEIAVFLQDLLALGVSLAASGLVREALRSAVPGLKPSVPPSEYVHLIFVFVPAWALGAERHRLQRVATLTGPPINLLLRVVFTQAWGTVALALILVGAQARLNRSFIGLFLVISTVTLLLLKLAQRRWVERHHGRALALVMGVTRGGRPGELEEVRGRRVEVLETWTPAALRERLRQGGVDEVVVAPVVPRDGVRPLLEACDEAGVPALLAVERLDLGLRPPDAEMIGRTLYLSYQRHEPERPALLLKAVIDRVAALVLTALLLPLLAVVGLLVKLTSKGPMLFVQQRGGLNGHAFPMLKFRTMRVGAEAERDSLLAANEMDGPVFKIANDPRITPFGSWLRRTSLDEVPQLLNVLAGHMSLVGPRPLPVVETRGLVGSYRRRLSMRPGITGLWQVSGRNQLGFDQWMALDLEYVDHWSLGLDIAILLRTLPALLSARGAQ